MSGKVIDIESLVQLIEGLSRKTLVEQRESARKSISSQDIYRLLPKFEFTEAVGDPTSEDRQELKKFLTDNVYGTNLLEDRILELQNFSSLTPDRDLKIRKSADVSVLLKRLMMLKILYNILAKSSAQSAGLQMEAYLASLLGGEQITINRFWQAADFKLGNTNYQLKIIQQSGTVSVSSTNLDQFFNGVEKPEKKISIAPQSDYLYFLIGYKTMADNKVAGLDFYLKDVSRKDFANWLAQNRDKKEFVLSNQEIKTEDNKLGSISVSEKIIKQWGMALDSKIRNVFAELANLINNVNLFYFEERNDAARDGITNCSNISNQLNKQTR